MSGSTPFHHRVPEETRARIIKRLIAGEYRCDVARSLGVSEYSVSMIAKKEGIKYARCPTGSRWGKAGAAAKPKIENDVATEWRAKAYASRRFGGSGYVT